MKNTGILSMRGLNLRTVLPVGQGGHIGYKRGRHLKVSEFLVGLRGREILTDGDDTYRG